MAPETLPTKRTRKTKVSHRGVQLLPPRPEAGKRFWSLKWRDVETRSWRYRLLPGITRRDGAIPEAIRQAHKLDAAKRAIEVHGQCAIVAIADESQRYQRESALAAKKGPNKGKPLAPFTQARYRSALIAFELWCAGRGVSVLRELTRAVLSDFRTHLASYGAMLSSVNFNLKPVRQMLLAARAGGRFESLDSDAIRAALARYPEPAPTPECLTAQEVEAKLTQALALDVRAGLVVAIGVLAGLRRGEVASLTVGSFVPSEPARDGTTRPVLRVTGKTGARTVELLPYSPLLVELLTKITDLRPATQSLHGLTYEQIGDVATAIGIEFKALRSTCASWQQPLPGDLKRKASRLGHTLAIAERHYLALPPTAPLSAASLDEALGCEAAMRALIDVAHSYYFTRSQPLQYAGTRDRNPRRPSPRVIADRA